VLNENDCESGILSNMRKISFKHEDHFWDKKSELYLSLVFIKKIVKGILHAERKCPRSFPSLYEKK
jgi:hypothetical protein